MFKRTILITGAAGRIGTTLRKGLRGEYDLRGFDVRPTDPPDSSVVVGDLADIAALERAMAGVEVVVHLAAKPSDAPFATGLVPPNVVGAYNTFEAARHAGVRRVVFASTAQLAARYPKDRTHIPPTAPPRPFSLYSTTKALGEALGRWFHDAHGLEVVVVRIGWFLDYDQPELQEHPDAPDIWLSPRDCVRLFRRAIEAGDVGYTVVYGTSLTSRERLGRDGWDRLGYAPLDDVAGFRSSASSATPP